MDIFDKIGNVANETYKYTAEKTSKIAKEAKMKKKINEYKSKIDELYEQIGKIIYQKHIREENINIKEDIEEYCKQIDNLSDAIEKNRMQLLNLKDKKQCEKCFAQINIYDKYCPNCGAKQEKNNVEVKSVENINEDKNTDANINVDVDKNEDKEYKDIDENVDIDDAEDEEENEDYENEEQEDTDDKMESIENKEIEDE